MKVLICLAIFCTQFAFARSRIGEWAAYDYTEVTNSTSIQGTLVKEIIEEKQVTSSNGKSEKFFKISEKMLNGGGAIALSDSWVPASQLVNVIGSNLNILKCRFIKSVGSVEKIQVKAGRFTACKLKDQEVWVGAVPFNQVLSIQHDETVFRRFELVKYSWKNK